jgi:hypothetical protein
VNIGVMGKFHSGEKSRPFFGFSLTKDAEVGFYLLIHVFSFTIRLWVIAVERETS